VAVAAGFGLRVVLTAWAGPGLPTYITFYPAVMVAALLAGFGPGLLATALASLTVACWVLPPEGISIASPVDRVGLMLFAGMGLFMSAVAELYRRSRRKAAAYAREVALRETRREKEFLADILEHASQAFAVGYPDGRLGLCNHAYEQLTGYSAEELRAIDWAAITPLEWHEPERQKLEELRRSGQPVRYEKEYVRKDGTRVPIELLVHLVKEAAGQPEYYYSFLTDITERKQAEEALRQGEERLNFALETIRVGAWDLDLVDHTAFRSLEHDRLFGYAELLPKWTYEMFLEHVLPEDRVIVDGKFKRAMEDHGDWSFECRIRRIDGQIRWIWAAGQHRQDAAGAPRRMAGIVQDITDRKRAEETLAESEERFRTMANAMPQLAWIANADGWIHWYNRRWYEYTGTTPEQMKGWGWQSVHDPAELPKVLERWKASIATGEPFEMTFPLRGADGVFRLFLTRGFPLKDAAGRVTQWFGTNTDVTELKRTEEALRESEQQLKRAQEILQKLNKDLEQRVAERTAELRVAALYARNLLEASLDPLVTISQEGKITDVNQATELVTGVSREKLIGTDFSDYFAEPDKAREGYQRVFGEGLVRDYPLAIRHASGRVTDALYNASVYHNAAGEVQGVFAAARDVTERNRAEAELAKYRDHLEELVKLRTAELASSNQELEQFAYVASHDLQEPLRAVTGYLSLIENRLRDKLDDKSQHHLNGAVQGATRMHALITDLLALSRVGTQGKAPEPIDLNAVLDRALQSVSGSAQEAGVRITRDPLPTLCVDAVQMAQLFQNLIGNAIKFRNDRPAEIHVSAQRQADDSWLFAVRDNGIGIEPQYFERIFLIFQRLHTRNEYPGTGIGLAICKKIVERHGGRLWVESQPGQGSSFYFTISNKGTP
jgi:PAS domain S-box-containing protein